MGMTCKFGSKVCIGCMECEEIKVCSVCGEEMECVKVRGECVCEDCLKEEMEYDFDYEEALRLMENKSTAQMIADTWFENISEDLMDDFVLTFCKISLEKNWYGSRKALQEFYIDTQINKVMGVA